MRSGGVVGVRQEEQARRGRHRREHGVDVPRDVADEGHLGEVDVGGEQPEPIADKRRIPDDRVIAGLREGPAREVDELVRAVADDDLVHRHAVVRGERFAQRVRGGVRVATERRGRSHERLGDPRRGAERVLVGGELHRVLDAELALELFDGLPGDVGDEAFDVGRDEAIHGSPGAHAGRGKLPSIFSQRLAPRSSSVAERTDRSDACPSSSMKNT